MTPPTSATATSRPTQAQTATETTTVRNKALEAFDEIMGMPL